MLHKCRFTNVALQISTGQQMSNRTSQMLDRCFTNVESCFTNALRNRALRISTGRNSNSNGAMPVHLIITMIKWIRTRRLSMKNFLPPHLNVALKISTGQQMSNRALQMLDNCFTKALLNRALQISAGRRRTRSGPTTSSRGSNPKPQTLNPRPPARELYRAVQLST